MVNKNHSLFQSAEDCERIEKSELAALEAEVEASGAVVAALAAGSRSIVGYRLTVFRGEKTGLKRMYAANARKVAQRAADKLDMAYGAICSTVQPVWGAS